MFNFFGLFLPVNQILDNCDFDKTILIICHGELNVPPNGWGAVEKIVSEVTSELNAEHYKTIILNSKSIFAWITVRIRKIDLIFLHDDTKILRTRFFWPRHKLILFSHYGYAGFEQRWTRKYRISIQNYFKLADLVVCLSPTIYNQYSRYLDSNKLLIVPNGISLNFPLHDFSIITSSNKNLICLGKVEPRKKQFELYKILEDTKISVDFVGPIIDNRVLRLLKSEEKLRKVFLGEKSNTYLNKLFSDYRCLIHVSEAEADALVLYEAQLAGLSIIVTENSIGSQNSKLPWIKVIPNNFNLADIEFALSSVVYDKVQVANFARANYGWKKQLKPLIERLDTL
jgi:hypothetical protein